jgi:lysine-N-methylase
MTRFKCLADRCEDTCCSGLGIYIVPEELAALEAAVQGKAQLKARLVRSLDKDAELPPGYAALLNKPGEPCTFLGPTKLCTLIEGGGAAGLPFICSTFPRRFVHLPDGSVEVGASMSCPEMARLCLLSDDAHEVVDAPPGVSERYPPAPPPDPSMASFESVREWGARRLTDRGQPLSARLLALADLAERESMEAADGAEARAAVSESAASGQFLAGLRGVLMALQSHPSRTTERYLQIVAPALQAFHAEVVEALGAGPPSDELYWPEVHQTFGRRLDRARSTVGGPLELYLERFCVNVWWTEPYVRAPTLRSYAFRLAARAALIRFLWMAHPAIDALARAQEPVAAGEPRARLDAAAIEVVQVVARLFESGSGTLDILERFFTPEVFGGDALEPVAQFARICG